MNYVKILAFMSLLLLAACGSDDPAIMVMEPEPEPDPDVRELTIPATGYSTPESYDGMTLVWQDEFNATTINEEDWNFDIGTGENGWGNNEAQYYRKENSSIVDGNLIIEARREGFSGSSFTSSRLTTLGKQEVQYGRIDVRAVLPTGSGMWPAIWMLGSNFPTVGWPKCGEIDIMEMFGAQGSSQVLGTVHWDNAGSPANFGGKTTLASGSFNDEYHVFSIVWDDTFIRWYVDDREYHVIDITPSELNELTESFYFILNVAVGGDKGAGDPNAGTVFPQWMVVDYIRVFQNM
jgi:beta-glucanase (GH16 family)